MHFRFDPLKNPISIQEHRPGGFTEDDAPTEVTFQKGFHVQPLMETKFLMQLLVITLCKRICNGLQMEGNPSLEEN